MFQGAFDTLRQLAFPERMAEDDPSEVGVSPGRLPGAPYEPSPVDVLVIKAMLIKAIQLPGELVNNIVEFAEYFPCSRTFIEYPKPISTGSNGNLFLVRPPSTLRLTVT